MVDGGLDIEQAKRVLHVLHAFPNVETNLRSDHPDLAFSSRGSRALADTMMATEEGRTQALAELGAAV